MVNDRRLGQSARYSMSRRIIGDAFCSEFRKHVRPYRSIYNCDDEGKASEEPKFDHGVTVSLFADVRFRVAGWWRGEGCRLNDAPPFAWFQALDRPFLLFGGVTSPPTRIIDFSIFDSVGPLRPTPCKPGRSIRRIDSDWLAIQNKITMSVPSVRAVRASLTWTSESDCRNA